MNPHRTKPFEPAGMAHSHADAWPAEVPHSPHTSPAPFRSIGIVGVGLIGGSLALAVRRAWQKVRIAGLDHGAALEAARLLVAFDTLGDRVDVLKGVELVVLAAPVRQNAAVLRELAGALEDGVVVTDVGSTKRAILEAAGELPARVAFIGGHPLAGAARAGLALARGDLFEGRRWLLSPPAGYETGDGLARLETLVRGLGAEPEVIDAAAHDRLLAYLSHLPQLTASALMDTVGRVAGDRIDLAGPGLADTTRLASSPSAIWEDICATNADAIGPALDALIARLQALRSRVGEPSAIAELFASAQAWRERLG